MTALLYGSHSPDSSGTDHSIDSSITLVSSESATTVTRWCYDRGDTFTSDIRLARCLTEQFWTRQFNAWGLRYQRIRSFKAYVGTRGPRCYGEASSPDNAFYCPESHIIAYDQNYMRRMYKKIGDGVMYMVIPHEFAHSVQAQLGLRYQYTVQQELQADCMAGATLAAVVRAGQVQLEPGDLQEIIANFEEIGDPDDAWWEPGKHGRPDVRASHYAKGYQRGMNACF
ncbi:neutral zinc metallopeptidase [Sphaerimonospora sp. CA-214678]|uniref:neutral zinc metallopeptidase n=1 Tax=Sphaerimonospora sp. CA-214678 TaxID=3240029 RepID=UPI003D8CBE19